MDKRQRTIDIVTSLHNLQDGAIDAAEFIKKVSNYFDAIKSSKLSRADLLFLSKIAALSGITHYFDHLKLFGQDIDIDDYDLSALSDQIYDSSLHTDVETKLHKYQKEILQKFEKGQLNRYFLSASTSFGKTHLVYEVIKKMDYENIVLLFPTIALLTENLEKIYKSSEYGSYNVHTLSDVSPEDMLGKNIFVYTPERFLSFLEKQLIFPLFDFIFIDEVYKIDNEYIIDEEEAKEHERDVSYRIATYYSVIRKQTDIFLAGPYIEKYGSSFESFLKDNYIEKLDFNKFEIVGKKYTEIKTAKKIYVEDGLEFEFNQDESKKTQRLKQIVSVLCSAHGKNENAIVYCSAPPLVEKYAKEIPNIIEYEAASEEFKHFVQHVQDQYSDGWVVVTCLKKGVGVHHGLVPKYIQKELVHFFNAGEIKVLVSTTTITEGVNTSAKNLVVINNKKGHKPLKKFDAKNIAGRAGRFDKHYSGRVIVLNNKFMQDIKKDSEEIKHQHYDSANSKNEVDIFYTKDDFLSIEDLSRKQNLKSEQEKRSIPDDVLDMFKIVSRQDKLRIFDEIARFSDYQYEQIGNLVRSINQSASVQIHWDGFEIVQEAILPIIKNGQLKGLVEKKIPLKNEKTASLLTIITSSYLESGFGGLVTYKCDKQNQKIDSAIRETARFVYNVAKYQLVKYLGVFNVMYKLHLSQKRNVQFGEVRGIDRLLTKLEYNALTEIGRKVSDFGVTENVLKYYEEGRNQNIQAQFDPYEHKLFDKVESIIRKKQ